MKYDAIRGLKSKIDYKINTRIEFLHSGTNIIHNNKVQLH
jgi:hypothetical protein